MKFSFPSAPAPLHGRDALRPRHLSGPPPQSAALYPAGQDTQTERALRAAPDCLISYIIPDPAVLCKEIRAESLKNASLHGILRVTLNFGRLCYDRKQGERHQRQLAEPKNLRGLLHGLRYNQRVSRRAVRRAAALSRNRKGRSRARNRHLRRHARRSARQNRPPRLQVGKIRGQAHAGIRLFKRQPARHRVLGPGRRLTRPHLLRPRAALAAHRIFRAGRRPAREGQLQARRHARRRAALRLQPLHRQDEGDDALPRALCLSDSRACRTPTAAATAFC